MLNGDFQSKIVFPVSQNWVTLFWRGTIFIGFCCPSSSRCLVVRPAIGQSIGPDCSENMKWETNGHQNRCSQLLPEKFTGQQTIRARVLTYQAAVWFQSSRCQINQAAAWFYFVGCLIDQAAGWFWSGSRLMDQAPARQCLIFRYSGFQQFNL